MPVPCRPRVSFLRDLPVLCLPKELFWKYFVCTVQSFSPACTVSSQPFSSSHAGSAPHLDMPWAVCLPVQTWSVYPIAPPRTSVSVPPLRPVDQSAPPWLLGSTWDHRPYDSTGLPRPSGSALVNHHSTCTIDIRAFSCASSLHPFGSSGLRLGPQLLRFCLSPPAPWLQPWLVAALQDQRRCLVTLHVVPRLYMGLHSSQLRLVLVFLWSHLPRLLPPSTSPWAFILALLLGVPPWLLMPLSSPWPCLTFDPALRPPPKPPSALFCWTLVFFCCCY